MKRLCLAVCLVLLVHTGVWAEITKMVSLVGHLSKERLDEAASKAEMGHVDVLAIEVDSVSGDLPETLRFARRIFRVRARHRSKIIVYIDSAAIGPAAVIPFLADELITSLVVAWGDIAAGDGEGYPKNLLRSQVQNLIIPDTPQAELFGELAEAMIDPGIYSVERPPFKVTSKEGETLVLNQNQLQKLGLVTEVLSAEEFREQYGPESKEEERPSDSLAISATRVERKLAHYVNYSPDKPNMVGHIMLGHEGITQSTFLYVQSAIDYYKELKPSFVILELNTPGGEVFAAEQISDVLTDLDTNDGIPVVAFINNWAMSAGALLAYSCRFIAVAKDGAMGAAEPVLAAPGGEMKPASEKISSALRADFANRAAFFDRDPLIAEAMVDRDVILVLRHGEVVKLNSEEEIRKIGPDPDVVITQKGKLLTLNAEQLIELGVADFMVPVGAVAPLTGAEKESGQWPADKSPLFLYPFFQEIPNATIDAYQIDWKVRFFAFLAHPVVASILFLAMMLGFYIELNTPGFGVPGTLGLIALFLVILSSFAIQAATWLELILLVAGLVLIALEVFVIPGFGLAGIAGIVLTVLGIISLMLPGLDQIDFEFDTGTLNAAGEVFLERLAWLGGTIVVGVIIMVLLGKYVLPRFSYFRRLVLTGEQESSAGYFAGPDIATLPKVGSEGRAITPLRLVGKVEIEGEIYSASSQGAYIDADESIVIVSYRGSRMIVDRQTKDDN